MSDKPKDDVKVVPIPASDTESDHQRVRASNDKDQRAEQHGRKTRHNEGYDEAADGPKGAPRGTSEENA